MCLLRRKLMVVGALARLYDIMTKAGGIMLMAREVLDFNGKPLSFRLLAHPHVNEQPFTRGQCDIEIPSEVSRVMVRAKCNKHGYGGKIFVVDLRKN